MKKESKKFIYLGLIFVVIWAINILFISPNLPLIFGENLSPLIRTIIKFIIWCGYGYYFITLYNKDLSLKKDELFKMKNIAFTIKLLIILVIAALTSMFIHHGHFHINDFTLDDFFNKFLLVGIEEELVFRALILNGLSKKNSFLKASLITSFLFAIIHVPSYINLELELLVIITNCLKIMVISSLYNYIFKETKSIWPIVIIHSAWDLLFFLFMA
ncbi:MAG: CPBP family intramembrane metalloprotease [Bacilli bacterium]|nr:CPBP family intramembrane metalloprotease [Bacilli bacterium]